MLKIWSGASRREKWYRISIFYFNRVSTSTEAIHALEMAGAGLVYPTVDSIAAHKSLGKGIIYRYQYDS
jgi:hypothetical protein